jgi:hypothetical protein
MIDRAQPLLADLLGGRQPVHDGHLDVHDHQVGLQIQRQLDGLLTIAGLADHVIAGLAEHLDEVEADERLVLGDDDPARGAARAVSDFVMNILTECRHSTPHLGVDRCAGSGT